MVFPRILLLTFIIHINNFSHLSIKKGIASKLKGYDRKKIVKRVEVNILESSHDGCPNSKTNLKTAQLTI